jgi:cell division protein FtsW (lipid II flippase)
MAGLSRDESASIAVIGTTVAVFAWYQTDLTGIQRWTNVLIVLLVSVAVATATTFVLKKWNPSWYRS